MTTTNLGGTLPSSESDSQKVGYYNDYLQNVLEPVISSTLSLSVAGSSNVTLTTVQGRNAQFVFTGALTGNIVVFFRVPAGTTAGYSSRRFSVYNNTTGAFSLTVKTTASGSTGIAVPQGSRQLLEHDGTNVYASSMAQTSTGLFVPCASVYHNANQSIGNSTLTVLSFNTERWDTDIIHDTATNNSRMTCKTAGKYDIKFAGAFAANATGVRYFEFFLNGATTIGADIHASAGASQVTAVAMSRHYDLAVNDYVEVRVFQDSGGSLNLVTGANYSPEFSLVRVG